MLVEEGETVIAKADLTVTVTVVVLTQPFAFVPVTVYVVVVAGLAVTEAPVVEDKPVAGLQRYVLAPFAVRTVPPPPQTAGAAGDTDNTGNGFIVIVAVPDCA